MTIPRNDMFNYWSTPDNLLNSSVFNDSISTPLQHLNTQAMNGQSSRFASPVSSPDGLQIRNTNSHPETGGLFDETGEQAGRVHLGLDIAAEIGTGISAAEAGVVAFAGWAKGYGNVVYINHADGYQTRYAHLSEINVQAGAVVAQGDLIGLAGKTGNADFPSVEPHVHFEVRKILDTAMQDSSSSKAIQNSQSKPVDPLPLLLGQTVPQAAQMQLRSTPPKAPPPPPKKYPEEENQQQDSQAQEENSKTTTAKNNEPSASQEEGQGIIDKLYRFMNANRDENVTSDELRSLFTGIMQQNGGKVTQNTLSKILGAEAKIGFGKRGIVAGKLMDALDTNGDNTLTSDEVDSMVQSILSKCDQNGDQKISREELGRIS